MTEQRKTNIEQKLTELETEAAFILLDELGKKGWGYGTSNHFNSGAFTGPNDEFDLRFSMRTGEYQLQWALTYPSSVGHENMAGPFSGHTLTWEYLPGETDEQTEQNFIKAALKSIEEITALPRI